MKKGSKSEYDLVERLEELLNLFARRDATILEKFMIKKPQKKHLVNIWYMIFVNLAPDSAISWTGNDEVTGTCRTSERTAIR